jgi:hypothetical protein
MALNAAKTRAVLNGKLALFDVGDTEEVNE